MRKMKSFAVAALAALAVVGCSSNNKEVEQASVNELYNKGSSALQEGSFTDSIRYLNAVTTRFPGSTYQEQAMLDLIYANYKAQDYTATLMTIDSYLNQFPQSSNRDYAVYMAGLTNLATADNAIQDFFGIDRSTRENTSLKTAFSNFQSLVRAFPQSPYSQDALARMAYIKDMLARHELDIAKFYYKRDAYVATANRVVGMLQLYPDAKATYDALPLMRDSYEKMGLKTLAEQTQQVINANQNKQFGEVKKPEEPSLIERVLPWFGGKKEQQ